MFPAGGRGHNAVRIRLSVTISSGGGEWGLLWTTVRVVTAIARTRRGTAVAGGNGAGVKHAVAVNGQPIPHRKEHCVENLKRCIAHKGKCIPIVTSEGNLKAKGANRVWD